jgi:phosphate transport system permease protein
MTGIIAQEMGEVEFGSIHYRALFMVGIALFLIALLVNFLSQTIAGRYKANY